MHPLIYQHGAFFIPSYGVVYLVAFLASIFTAASIGPRYGLSREQMIDATFFMAIVGEIGARLTFVAIEWRDIVSGAISPRDLLYGGRVLLAGVLVGFAAALWFAHRHRMDILKVCDAAFTGTALGIGIGRLGCLLAGCCFGAPTDWWWGIVFRDPLAHKLNGTPLGVPLHPTQIIQAISGFALFAGLMVLYRRRTYPGQVVGWFLIACGLLRYPAELLRGDPRGAYLGLATSQWISIGMVLGGIVWLAVVRRRAALATA